MWEPIRPGSPVGPNEKNMIGWMYERETKREKSLEQIKKQGGGAKKDHPLDWEKSPVQTTLGFFPKRHSNHCNQSALPAIALDSRAQENMTGEYEGKQGNHNNLKQLEGF